MRHANRWRCTGCSRRAIWALVLALGLYWFPGPLAQADGLDFDGPPWHLALGVGPSIFPWPLQEDEPSSFQRQLQAAGYRLPTIGGVFDLALDYLVIDFLTLGIEASYHLHRGATAYELEPDIRIDNDDPFRQKYGFHRLTGFLFAKATLRGEGAGANIEASLQVAGGFGAVFWTMRGETEIGTEFVLRPGLVADWYWDRFCLGYRMAVPFVWFTDLGPWELTHGPTMTVEVTMQTGVRW
ncbi:MAG: hypothetical protein JW797_17475 [Bradymonadales bacterium]|nr:hypothetical protein [Bradymonadales bacterium]